MKPAYKSKTIWFNVMTGGVALASQIAPVVQDIEGAEVVYMILVMVNVIGNIILRNVTDQPLGRP